MMKLGEKYITIGDKVVNTQQKTIGCVTRIESNNVDNESIYTVMVDYSDTNKVFGMGKLYQRRYVFSFSSIEPMHSINMYSKKKNRYPRPIFNLMPSKYIKKYNMVKVIDNDYIKNTLANFTKVGINKCVTTQTGVWTRFGNRYYSKFDLTLHIIDLNVFGTDMVKCSYYKVDGCVEIIYVPHNCLELVKDYNFITRLFVKYRIKKATT